MSMSVSPSMMASLFLSFIEDSFPGLAQMFFAREKAPADVSESNLICGELSPLLYTRHENPQNVPDLKKYFEKEKSL